MYAIHHCYTINSTDDVLVTKISQLVKYVPDILTVCEFLTIEPV